MTIGQSEAPKKSRWVRKAKRRRTILENLHKNRFRRDENTNVYIKECGAKRIRTKSRGDHVGKQNE